MSRSQRDVGLNPGLFRVVFSIVFVRGTKRNASQVEWGLYRADIDFNVSQPFLLVGYCRQFSVLMPGACLEKGFSPYAMTV